ncbi:MAG: hypothetical protein JW778_06020 [Candidatus Altiarchaeota archaeon]|nr:hypothetical protein [Candidatus Altiarchaeota archaeon]
MFKPRICPKCGSTEIAWVFPPQSSTWECEECGYRESSTAGERNPPKRLG